MRQDFKTHRLAQMMAISMTVDFQDYALDEVASEKWRTDSILPGDVRRIAKQTGK